MPVLHLIAGPHGAGKTTLYRTLVAPWKPQLPFVDAQAWPDAPARAARDAEACARAARAWADKERQTLLHEGQSFVTETAFSHRSRVALLAQARTLGFEVVLYAIALDDPRVLLQRLDRRAREGGPAVPSHKVLQRYSRAMSNLREAIYLSDLVFLVESSDVAEGGPHLVASVLNRRIRMHTVARPRWVDRALGFSEG
jgi:predicted ABC-type ATPase